jgi:hypothetical protein
MPGPVIGKFHMCIMAADSISSSHQQYQAFIIGKTAATVLKYWLTVCGCSSSPCSYLFFITQVNFHFSALCLSIVIE